MSSSLDLLRKECETIRERRNQGSRLALRCPMCGNQTLGGDALMEHVFQFHSVVLEQLDNVVDLGALLAFLEARIRRLEGAAEADPDVTKGESNLRCAVCLKDCRDSANLKEHVEKEDHGVWDRHAIPALQAFCIASTYATAAAVGDDPRERPAGNETSSTSDTEEVINNDKEGDVDDGEAVGDLDDSEEEVEEAQCLYCASRCPLRALESHCRDVHHVSFREYFQLHPTTDEYRAVRLGNLIRDYRAALRCPSDACGRTFGTCEEWQAHVDQLEHHFPQEVPTGDHYLIPRIPGDLFLSHLLEIALDGEDEATEEDYPMVDTVQQLAAKRRQGEAK